MKKISKLSLVGILAGAVLFGTVGCLGEPPTQDIPDDGMGGGYANRSR